MVRVGTRFLSEKKTVLVIYTAFFASGTAGLIYEISWSRQLGLLFGQTVQASAIVVSSFFAGMALGYGLAVRLLRRVHPLRGYALAEWVVALWACLIPFLLQWLRTPQWAPLLHHPSPAVQTGIRLVVCFLILLPATVSLGLTFPFIAETLSPRNRPAPHAVARAYVVNTCGAIFGVVMATAVLLVTVGVKRSSWLAAGISVLCGCVVYPLAKRMPGCAPGSGTERKGHSDITASSPMRVWVLLAILSGFGTLALQVLYFRIFSLVLHNSTYTFGAVLTVFLAALAVGASLSQRWLRRHAVRNVIGWACMLGALLLLLTMLVFLLTTRLEYLNHGRSFVSHMLGVLTLAAVVIGPPLVLLGMVLPATWNGALQRHTSSGRVVGILTATNTLAATLGSLVTAFVLLPLIGLWTSFLLVVLSFYLGGAVLLWPPPRRSAVVWLGAVVLACGVGFWGLTQRVTLASVPANTQLMQRWETAYGWLDVVGVPEKNWFALRENLHYIHGDTAQSATREYRQGHLPLLLHPDPRHTLFLGLGTGMTAGAALQHPELVSLDAVELIPEVVEGARYFQQANHGLLTDPRVRVHVDDARHWLLASDKEYDLIVSDLFVPWQSKSGYLYTVEHYREVRRHLKASGVFCQWLTFNQIGTHEFEMIANSFASVFPVTNLWWGRLTPQQGMVMLVGSAEPLAIEGARLHERLTQLNAASERPDPYLRSVPYFCRLYLGRWPAAEAATRLNTDEFPRIEFLTPLTYRERKFLTFERLIMYLDRVLFRLPADGMQFRVPLEEAESLDDKHALQRQVLLRQMSRP